MKRILTTLLAVAIAWPTAGATMTLETATASFQIDEKGWLVALIGDGRNYIATDQPSPLAQVRVRGQWWLPDSATWDEKAGHLTLRFSVGLSVTLKVEEKRTHGTFDVLDVQPRDQAELLLWGPYATTIGEFVGEVVGVVRDEEFAVGIQALNSKTLGGHPDQENDIDTEGSLDDPGRYPDLATELNRDQSFRGSTARPTAFGSVLQAYCRNREHDRVIPNWGHERYVAPAYQDAGLIGSKIALFACPASKALATIGEIELAEGLPHPMLDGVWAKEASEANASYLIVDFGEHNIDQAVAMTQAAGLRYLYHSSPFETWGHFKLKPDLFPRGWNGLQTCVEKARKAGVLVGVHSLSNFITPTDAYVTPNPDPRLARIGSSSLATDVDDADIEISVELPEFFLKKTDMNTVVIGDELIQYESVSGESPWRLLGCRRGAWGTRATSHRRGAAVGKLMDHSYKVFLGNVDLSMEVARNLAGLFNVAGLRQFSMDGLEGNWSTGLGQYGRTLFVQAWYEALNPKLRGGVRNDASNPGHFNWHINTYYNWGEPWYAGFRESQTIYRFKNQLFYTRNLLPRMLGWFSLRPDTTLADAEWLLARAAGYGAGFALATSIRSTAQLTAADADPETRNVAVILEAVRQWETARLAQAFPPDMRTLLRDNTREFHLEPVTQGEWDIYPVESGQRGAAVRIKAKECPGDARSVIGGDHAQSSDRLQQTTSESMMTLDKSIQVLLDEYMRDPSICLGPDSTYYLTGTTAGQNSIQIWKSKDLKQWEKMSFEWRYGDSPWHKPYQEARKPLWAPELHYLKGTFWLAYSMPGWDETPKTSGSGLLRSTSGRPEGPYVDVQPNERLGDEIDASLFQEDDGEVYFVWHCGKIRKMKPDMSGPAEPPRKLAMDVPDPDPNRHGGLCEKIHGPGSFDHVGYEGAFLFKSGATYYLSASEICEGRYSCMIATSKNIYGPYSARYEAIPWGGHNMFFKDQVGDWWCTIFNGPVSEKAAILPVAIDPGRPISLRKPK